MFDCHDCKPLGFGNAAVPPRPRGYYRTLWQIQDAMGCRRRMYPSAWLDCMGYIEKHDNWEPYLLAELFQVLAGGGPFAARQALLWFGGSTVTDAAIATAGFFAPDFPRYNGWMNVMNKGDGNPVVGLQYRIVAGNFIFYDMRDMSSFTYAAPPSWVGAVTGVTLAMTPPDIFGSPFWNAL